MFIAVRKNNVSFGSLILKLCPSILSMIEYKTSLLKLPKSKKCFDIHRQINTTFLF